MSDKDQLTFGVHSQSDADQEWKKINAKSINPCVDMFGRGPIEKMCRTCSHLTIKSYTRNFYKCDLRQNTNGPKTDHRLFWPACAKYEEAPK